MDRFYLLSSEKCLKCLSSEKDLELKGPGGEVGNRSTLLWRDIGGIHETVA